MNFRIGKTKFELSYPLVCIMSAVLISDRSMTVLTCFLCALMHEMGHIAAMRAFGTVPESIKLTLFDIAITDRKKVMRKRSHDLIITLSGIAVNFISAVLGFILFRQTGQPFFYSFTAAHLTLGIFNLLPVDTLDGGQALMLILTSKLPPLVSERILTISSVIILMPLACLGFWTLLETRYNFTLLLAALYLIAVLLFRRSASHTKKPTAKAASEAASATAMSGSLK